MLDIYVACVAFLRASSNLNESLWICSDDDD